MAFTEPALITRRLAFANYFSSRRTTNTAQNATIIALSHLLCAENGHWK
jgi:hypothetical protein